MSRADYIIGRVDSALKKIGGSTRTAYIRKVTRTGGDDLIGRAGTKTTTDTKFDPQPYHRQLGHRQAMLLSGTKNLVADDYHFTFSPKYYSESDFEDSTAFLVLKDSAGNEEVLRILYVNGEGFGGQTVSLSVIARSTARG